jgi:hypothetical protein
MERRDHLIKQFESLALNMIITIIVQLPEMAEL